MALLNFNPFYNYTEYIPCISMVLSVNKYEKYIKVINFFIFFPLLQFMIHSGDKNKAQCLCSR